MKKRVITAICFGAVFFPAIYFGGIYFLLVALFSSIVGTYELMNMFYSKNPTLKTMRFIVPAFSAALVFLMYMMEEKADLYDLFLGENGLYAATLSSYINPSISYAALILGVYLLFIVIFLILNVLIKNTSAQDLMACITSLTYGGLLLGAAFSIEYVDPIIVSGHKEFWGGQVFAYLYSVVVFTDMFAFFFGIKFGKHKLCPNISPKKSVEGSIAGLAFGSVFGTFFAWLFGVMPISSDASASQVIAIVLVTFIISLLISVVVQIGDLAESKLKRSYEIKDLGNILPGHGGIMDRFDSLILSGSFLYALIFIVKIILIGA